MKSEYTKMLLCSVNKEEFGRIQMLSDEKENSHFDFSEEWWLMIEDLVWPGTRELE